MERITAYVDGACKGNPGPGGYGVVVVYQNNKKEMSAGFEKTTNSRMELMAVQTVLHSFIDTLDLGAKYDITVFSDSKYVVNSFNKGWLQKWVDNGWLTSSGGQVANKDLWENIYELLGRLKEAGILIKFEWVRGHSGNENHDACDKLASKAATCQHCFCMRETI